ncbi:hypothetical protein FSP39_024333 [Pinctada imbricata]|uniref:Uncharacterized protein n=1 Tax=Pinctada imbricata TaxID=66713 RepID=A0AA88YF63_PINIB|nr:hypothetical protein FSP39_024333 [Pinctada imbricata]
MFDLLMSFIFASGSEMLCRASADYWNNESAKLNYVQNRFIPLKQRKFDDLVLDGLRGNPPGNYMNSRPRNSFNRNVYSNSYHDRAREGFRYWLIERPKPTKFGKYGMGSYKTVLGIGNAPRT